LLHYAEIGNRGSQNHGYLSDMHVTESLQVHALLAAAAPTGSVQF